MAARGHLTARWSRRPDVEGTAHGSCAVPSTSAGRREWLDVLVGDGRLTPGPLLRRIDRHGNIGAKAAGRPRTTAAAHHRRHRQRHHQGRRPRRPAHPGPLAAADAAPTAEEVNAILKAWRTARRAARASARRITGHCFRRGWIQQALAAGYPPETVAVHSRHSLRSTALDAYRRKKVLWNQNPPASWAGPPDQPLVRYD
ncbi:hypothetical protein [Streptomyces sp. NBC_01314]|uniref:hypothetical protein n=1 Tax=Streptomyces sp. NBC_01314 TaxID=2903821 RepID=UPI003093A1CA|nr:hypothetical protein OG622_46875 [Streptomyces sp. NBC_01314]